MSTIGDRLKLARTSKRWTQHELASRSGEAQSTIGGLESGRRKMPRNLVALCAALGVTPEWLVHGKEETTPQIAAANTDILNLAYISTREAALLTAFRESSDGGKRLIEATAATSDRAKANDILGVVNGESH